jgi:hypothetical protein
MKQRTKAIAELTGVRGDSARGKNSRVGPGRPDGAVLGKSKHKRGLGMHNQTTCPGRESDRLIVAKKRVTNAEQRGLSVDMSR